MLAAIGWGARDRFSAQVDAPLWVTAELTEQRRTGTMLLHILNFKTAEPLEKIPVSVRIPAGKQLDQVTLATPDGEPQVLTASVKEGAASSQVPRLKVYGMVILRPR